LGAIGCNFELFGWKLDADSHLPRDFCETSRPLFNLLSPNPFGVLRSIEIPELGEVFRGVPTRFKTNLFQKALRVESVSNENGIGIFHCTFIAQRMQRNTAK